MGRITDLIEQHDTTEALPHSAGSLNYKTLDEIERHLTGSDLVTAETGCGRSTILFSNLSKTHHVFCLDDTDDEKSSVNYFKDCPVTQNERVNVHFGATQKILNNFVHDSLYDCVLIDGPHGYPFPDLEYFYFYPAIKEGGLLIVDDLQIATIGRMADVIQDDDMWDTVSVVGKTAIFQRTSSDIVPPDGDHWWMQNFNRRRARVESIRLDEPSPHESFEHRFNRPPATGLKKMLRRMRNKVRGTS